MIKRLSCTVLLLLCGLLLGAQELSLSKGMKISQSSAIRPAVYQLSSGGMEDPVLVIEGDHIVVDFKQAVLNGAAKGTAPDQFNGVAILVRNSRNVTLRNLQVRGYKVAVRAVGVEGLVIEHADLSYNYRKRLNSTQEKEDISDWMSYHLNEQDEWLRYGAAIYLRDCNGAVVRNCRVTGGQNGLMMTGCNDATVYNNDFSFNSGIGIGMYRSNRNRFLFNKVNFNVRGYSHGVYRRGQDSAGFLVYEQSSNNLFYQNSATHSGDGFFLWAGQSTMDKGSGGCNDNFIIGNDFSYAPTNGIEVTFSSNFIIGNRIFDCDHGIWGGYSFNSVISENQFRQNRIAIAIEHGQKNRITGNLFSEDGTAIRLWARESQPADWAYAKLRDTRSREYLVASNSFNRNGTVYDLKRTRGLQLMNNSVSGEGILFKIDSTVSGIDSSGHFEEEQVAVPGLPALGDPKDPFEGNGRFRGRQHMMITEWGPYDFRYPLLWNINPVDSSGEMKFVLLGPPGKWKIRRSTGVSDFSRRSGSFPDTITVRRREGARTDIRIRARYRGAAFTNPFGEAVPAGRRHDFEYRKFFQPVQWTVLWYSMDTSFHHPLRTGELFSPVERKRPVKEEKTLKLDYAWWGGLRAEGETFPQFFTVAEGEAEFERAEYELSVTWDDAVRIYVDGILVVNEWDPSLYRFDESPNKKIRIRLGGRHQFRVEHVELGGFACLSLKFRKLD